MLIEKLTQTNQIVASIENSILELIKSYLDTNNFEDKKLIDSLNENLKNLNLGEVILPVIGRVNVGKSTLLAAIMGPALKKEYQEHGEDNPSKNLPVHIDSGEATAVPVMIKYGESPEVFLRKKSGETSSMSLEIYQNDYKARQNKEEHERQFGNLERFFVEFPNELLRLGIILEDLPGLDMNEHRTNIARKVIQDRSIGIFIFDTLFTKNDTVNEVFRDFRKGNCRIITVLNDKGFDNDEDKLLVAKQVYNLITDKNCTENDLSKIIEELKTLDTFFINAERALRGKNRKNEKSIKESGILDLESLLATLVSDKMISKVRNDSGERIIKRLEERENQLQTEIEELKREIILSKNKVSSQIEQNQYLEQEYQTVINTINKYKCDTINQLSNSYEGFMSELVNKITDYVDAHSDSIWDVTFNLKGDLEKVIVNEIYAWESKKATPILITNKSLLVGEIAKIESLRKTHTANISTTNQISIETSIGGWERVLSAAGGLLTGGVVTAAAGATMGAKGALGVGGLGLATGIIAIGVLHVGFIPAIIAVILAELVGFASAKDKIKKELPPKILKKAKETLEKASKQSKEQIKNFTNVAYNDLQKEAEKYFNEIRISGKDFEENVSKTQIDYQKTTESKVDTLETKKIGIVTTKTKIIEILK